MDLEFHTTYEHRIQDQLNCMQCDCQTNDKGLLTNYVSGRRGGGGGGGSG